MKEKQPLQVNPRKIAKESPNFQYNYQQELLRIELSEVMQEVRQEQGLSQEQFADLVGESQELIASIENGLWEPSLFLVQEILLRLSKRLSIQAVSLFALVASDE